MKPKLSLSERTYRCEVCALVLDRDVNAAANLAAWGEHQRGTCPCGGSPARDLHPAGPSGALRHACGGWVSGPGAQAPVPLVEAGTSQPLVA